MSGERIEDAVRRIEAALARIAAVADAPSAPAGPSTGARVEDLALRESVGQTLAELDGIIARLER